MTSLLRELVSMPIAGLASPTATSRPACANARAAARPLTPAPLTTHSIISITRQRQSVDIDVRRIARHQIRQQFAETNRHGPSGRTVADIDIYVARRRRADQRRAIG